MVRRVGAWGIYVVVTIGALGATGIVQAAPPILDTDTIKFESESDALTASIVITNTSEEPLVLLVDGVEELKGCQFESQPATIAARRSVTAKITSDKCEIPVNGGQIELKFGSNVILLSAQATKKPEALNVGQIVIFFSLGAFGALAIAASVFSRRPKYTAPPITYDPDGNPVSPQPDPPHAVGSKVGPTEVLPGLESDWSFSDSWATNISAFATIFVALVGTTSVLEAVLGAEPDQAVGRILVAGAIAGFLTGAAPLALKAIGKSAKPTVTGLLVGGALTLTGTIGQILTIGWAVSKTELEEPWRQWALRLSVAGAFFLLIYGYRTLTILLKDAFGESPEDSPDPVFYLVSALLAGASQPPPPASLIAQNAARLARATPPGVPPPIPRRWGTSPGDDYGRSALL